MSRYCCSTNHKSQARLAGCIDGGTPIEWETVYRGNGTPKIIASDRESSQVEVYSLSLCLTQLTQQAGTILQLDSFSILDKRHHLRRPRSLDTVQQYISKSPLEQHTDQPPKSFVLAGPLTQRCARSATLPSSPSHPTSTLVNHLPSPDSSPEPGEPSNKRLKTSVGVDTEAKVEERKMSSDEEFDDLVYEDDDEGFGEDVMEDGASWSPFTLMEAVEEF